MDACWMQLICVLQVPRPARTDICLRVGQARCLCFSANQGGKEARGHACDCSKFSVKFDDGAAGFDARSVLTAGWLRRKCPGPDKSWLSG